MARVYEVHSVPYMSCDKTMLYSFVDGLLRYATQSPDAAWYRGLLPLPSPNRTPLDVTGQWILPPGAPGAADAGPPPANLTTTISSPRPTPTTVGASTPTTNADAAVADRMTAAADRIDRKEGTLNAPATKVGSVEQTVKPRVLGEIMQQNMDPYLGFVAVENQQAAKRRRVEAFSGHAHQI
ncbi:hypothetical protein FN846DRAFT_886261 [Sphaerosporella brunnea]|uniref:Uncharacterized protein n=1 Tax=Sphaerosporella brunnea TaxID=1250544 RepID=A0A5J5F9H0_9PEZI|nr:hypothetical protein FN846DRAFT_886261 [Sphaerosporella brunnea]